MADKNIERGVRHDFPSVLLMASDCVFGAVEASALGFNKVYIYNKDYCLLRAKAVDTFKKTNKNK